MDNFSICVVHKDRQELELALRIAFSLHNNATHYVIHPEKGFILLWCEDTHLNSVKLPVPMTYELATDVIHRWLKTLADYPPIERDADVDFERGWQVYNEAWGHVAGSHAVIVAVRPVWIMYGK